MQLTKNSLALAALLMTAACSDTNEDVVSPSTLGESVTISVGMPETPAVRVAYNDGQVGSEAMDALTWESGDQLIAVGFDASSNYVGQSTFTITSGVDTRTGYFSGNAVSGASTYKIYVDCDDLTINSTTGAATFTLGTQTQTGYGVTSHLREHLYIYNDAVSASTIENNGSFTMDLGNSIMKFVLTNIPTSIGEISKLRWKVSSATHKEAGGTIARAASTILNFTSGSVVMGSTNASGNTIDSLTAYAAFIPDTMDMEAGGRFAVTLVNTSGERYMARIFSTSGTDYSAKNRYSAPIDGSSVTWKFLPDSIADLGLSAEWATHNIGAENSLASDFGGYFAWGEITPRDTGTFIQSNYKFYNSTTGGYTYNFGTTYSQNTSVYNGNVRHVAGNALYDAARYTWGDIWRMPFYSETHELFSPGNTTKQLRYDNGQRLIRMISIKPGYESEYIDVPLGGYFAPNSAVSDTYSINKGRDDNKIAITASNMSLSIGCGWEWWTPEVTAAGSWGFFINAYLTAVEATTNSTTGVSTYTATLTYTAGTARPWQGRNIRAVHK